MNRRFWSTLTSKIEQRTRFIRILSRDATMISAEKHEECFTGHPLMNDHYRLADEIAFLIESADFKTEIEFLKNSDLPEIPNLLPAQTLLITQFMKKLSFYPVSKLQNEHYIWYVLFFFILQSEATKLLLFQMLFNIVESAPDHFGQTQQKLKIAFEEKTKDSKNDLFLRPYYDLNFNYEDKSRELDELQLRGIDTRNLARNIMKESLTSAVVNVPVSHLSLSYLLSHLSLNYEVGGQHPYFSFFELGIAHELIHAEHLIMGKDRDPSNPRSALKKHLFKDFKKWDELSREHQSYYSNPEEFYTIEAGIGISENKLRNSLKLRTRTAHTVVNVREYFPQYGDMYTPNIFPSKVTTQRAHKERLKTCRCSNCYGVFQSKYEELHCFSCGKPLCQSCAQHHDRSGRDQKDLTKEDYDYYCPSCLK